MSLPDADTIDAFLADQHQGHKPATVHARFRALRALCLFLERRRKISHDDNPIHLVDAPSVPTEIRRHVSDTDMRRLLASIGDGSWLDARDRLILLILYWAGLRVGELCALRVDDMDAAALTIQIRASTAKGERGRLVPCTAEVMTAFVRYLYVRPNHRPELLLASDGYDGVKGPLQREGVRQMLIRRCAEAGHRVLLAARIQARVCDVGAQCRRAHDDRLDHDGPFRPRHHRQDLCTYDGGDGAGGV